VCLIRPQELQKKSLILPADFRSEKGHALGKAVSARCFVPRAVVIHHHAYTPQPSSRNSNTLRTSNITPSNVAVTFDAQVYVALDLVTGSLLAAKELNILDIPADDQRAI